MSKMKKTLLFALLPAAALAAVIAGYKPTVPPLADAGQSAAHSQSAPQSTGEQSGVQDGQSAAPESGKEEKTQWETLQHLLAVADPEDVQAAEKVILERFELKELYSMVQLAQAGSWDEIRSMASQRLTQEEKEQLEKLYDKYKTQINLQ